MLSHMQMGPGKWRQSKCHNIDMRALKELRPSRSRHVDGPSACDVIGQLLLGRRLGSDIVETNELWYILRSHAVVESLTQEVRLVASTVFLPFPVLLLRLPDTSQH
jgi:hypothetical protein